MAEAVAVLGAVSSVITIIDAGFEIITSIVRVLRSADGVLVWVSDLQRRITQLLQLLKQAREAVQRLSSSKAADDLLASPLNGCLLQLSRIKVILDTLVKEPSSTRKGVARTITSAATRSVGALRSLKAEDKIRELVRGLDSSLTELQM